MDAEKLRNFINEVSNLRTTALGTNISSAGFAGAMSPQDSMLDTLRRNVAAFAQECSKNAPKPVTLKELADEVEGGLQGLHSMSVINDKELEALISQLYALKT